MIQYLTYRITKVPHDDEPLLATTFYHDPHLQHRQTETLLQQLRLRFDFTTSDLYWFLTIFDIVLRMRLKTGNF